MFIVHLWSRDQFRRPQDGAHGDPKRLPVKPHRKKGLPAAPFTECRKDLCPSK